MDPAYSPHAAHASPRDRGRMASATPADFPPPPKQGSPPLVPVPEDHHRDHRAPSYDYHHPPPPQDGRTPYDPNAPPPPPGAAPPGYPPHDDRDRYYGSRPPEDPYAQPGYPPRRPDYPDYPPRPDYYGRPPPPPGYGAPDYYGRPPHPGYGPPPPRDPYGYPPRDPYGGYGAPPPGPDYYGRPPPPPPAPYGGGSYYGSAPPPPAAAGPPVMDRSAGTTPAPASATAAANAAQYGPPPDPNDLSIPLLYLARSVNLKTFTPLRAMYPNLDLRFVNSLLGLDADLHAVSLEHPNLLGHRRRVWVTAVGGTDALVHRVRTSMAEKNEVMDWREAGDIEELNRELAIEDRRVPVVRAEQAEKAQRGASAGAVEDSHGREERERQEYEMERGRREIEERERVAAAGAVVKSEPQELDEVLRQVRGDTAPEPKELSRDIRSESPLRSSRKRSRREEENMSEEASLSFRPSTFSLLLTRSSRSQDRDRRRAHRKKLESICKSERRRCVDWALQNGVPVNDETKLVDEEPQLGERHKGVWDLFGHPLDDVSPQIQVLMARAMRDATYPPRLRLYENADALDQLESAAPWFCTLINLIKDRYELAGADSAAPQDPPLPEKPFFTLPESSREVPTLGSNGIKAEEDVAATTA
ncbi:hypothetical protein JCM8097_006072 [Rhodosporidiobolus ruineniae]